MYIEKINGPEDVKKLTVDEMTVMAGERSTVKESQYPRRTLRTKLRYGRGNDRTALCIRVTKRQDCI
mgnify:CR=1 FL=1